jgi:hypothetical protein
MSFFDVQAIAFVHGCKCLFDAIKQSLLVALDPNQIIRPVIYDSLGYFVLPDLEINGDKAAFDF